MPTTPKGFGLGLIPDTHDDRDHLLAIEPEATPYRFVDLEPRKYTPPIWNQGRLGSCTAHGTLAGFLWASAKHGQNDPMLSRLQLYYNTRALEGTVGQDAGGQIRDAIKAAAQGIAPETDWPYDIARFTQKPPAVAARDAGQNIAIHYKRVPISVAGIQAVLTSGYPVVIGVGLQTSTFEADEALSTGVVPTPDPSDVDGAHCMAIWGIGTGHDWQTRRQFQSATLDPRKLYCKVRNSWGADVFQRGYLLMEAAEYLANAELGSDYWQLVKVS